MGNLIWVRVTSFRDNVPGKEGCIDALYIENTAPSSLGMRSRVHKKVARLFLVSLAGTIDEHTLRVWRHASWPVYKLQTVEGLQSIQTPSVCAHF